ncbi:hypothetical protein EON63_09115 [archaeon]|nr:MAG: hypothetical protein EON63_09115 [archaeon]
MPSDAFWSTIKHLPIKELGFTEKELDVIRKYGMVHMCMYIYLYVRMNYACVCMDVSVLCI